MKRLSRAEALVAIEVAGVGHPGCQACRLARDGEPIVANEHATAVLDRFASRPGHVLVMLRRHEERIAALAWPEYEAMQRLAWEVSRAIEAALAPVRIYVAALGSTAPLATSFPHVHLHVVPLYDGGEADRPANVFTWAHGALVFEDDREERALLAKLREAMPRTDRS